MIGAKDIHSWLACGSIMSCGLGRVVLGWGERRWIAAPSAAVQKEVFYFPDFFLRNPTPWFEQEHQCEMGIEELKGLLDGPGVSILYKYSWKCIGREMFKEAFDDLELKLSSNVLDKAVPFVFESTASLMSIPQLCRSLASIFGIILQYPVYAYGFCDQNGGMLGMTPELLFRYRSPEKLETMACAGTMPAKAGNAILTDPKEVHEHTLVVEGICDALAPFGRIAVETAGLLTLPNLAHLTTPITVALHSPPDFEKIVAALHPTPALGGTPRQAAMRWLEGYQKKIDRGRFGAPAGYLRPKDGEGGCYVAIRNAQWNREGIYVGAGCGIVAESRYEQEWDEINLKLQATKELLAL